MEILRHYCLPERCRHAALRISFKASCFDVLCGTQRPKVLISNEFSSLALEEVGTHLSSNGKRQFCLSSHHPECWDDVSSRKWQLSGNPFDLSLLQS